MPIAKTGRARADIMSSEPVVGVVRHVILVFTKKKLSAWCHDYPGVPFRALPASC